MTTERRRYTLNKRAHTAEDTHRRIVDAARALFGGEGYPNISLDEIAARAGVSRQTIYVQFGSKAGVLTAMVGEWLEQSLAQIHASLQGAEGTVQRIHGAITAEVLMMHEHGTMLRTFRAQSVSDPDFRAVFEEHMQRGRMESIRGAIARLAAEGQLAAGWSVQEAADWVFAVTDFPVVDELMSKRGWSPDAVAGRLIETVDALLLA